MIMKIRQIALILLVVLSITIPVFVQEPIVTDPGGEPILKAQCVDGLDNDGDKKIDDKDTECIAGARCEDGTTKCLPASATTNGSGLALKVVINNPLKVSTIQDAIKLFMDAVLKIAIPFIIIFFIWSGLSFVLARGNPEKIKTAKNMFLYTIIGTLLILGAWTITNAIIGTVNSITG